MSIDEILAGTMGVEGVRSLLCGAEAQRALAEEVSEMLTPGTVLESLRLHRSKFKPGRKLSAWYTAETRRKRSIGARPREIAVTWELGDPLDPRLAQQSAGDHAGPFRALHHWEPARRMQVLVSPFDPRFPGLARLAQPGAVAAWNPSHAGSPTTLRYRPGQRHLLRHGDGAAAVFVKLSRAQDPSRVATAAASLNRWFSEHEPALRVLQPLDILPGAEAVLFRHAPGHTAARNGPSLQRIGAAVRLLHGAPSDAVAGETRSLAGEVRRAMRAAEHLQVLHPSAAESLQATLEQAQELTSSLPAPAKTPVHGDLKLDHVWQNAELLTLIDLDRTRCDDPSLDVGKLLADIRWSSNTGRGVHALQQAFLSGYRGDPSTLIRAQIYEAIYVLKIAARRVSVTDSHWDERVSALVADARLVIDTVTRQATNPSPIGAAS